MLDFQLFEEIYKSICFSESIKKRYVFYHNKLGMLKKINKKKKALNIRQLCFIHYFGLNANRFIVQ